MTEEPPRSDRNEESRGLTDTAGRALAPVGRAGMRGVRGIGRRLGINRVVERVFDRSIDRALESETVERTAVRVLDSDLVDRLWQRVLASDEAQQLVERVAEAPEVRAAITRQGVGLLEDLRRGLRRAARRLDAGMEAFARRALRHGRPAERPIYAGAISRLLAVLLDAAILNGVLLLLSAAVALVVSALASGDQSGGTGAIAFGAAAWIASACAYLTLFWTLAERTPGMAFLGLRVLSVDGARLEPRQALRRLVGGALAALPLLLGFAGVLLDDRRRGWQDRLGQTVVLYADPALDRDRRA
jgi:uncharacterized RDD family membrane protein YckC